MALTGAGFSNRHHGSARAVKDQPDDSFHSPGDQTVDEHGKHGGKFKYHVSDGRRCDQTFKGEQEQRREPKDQGDDRALGIGADQLKSDAERDQSLENSKRQPDKLRCLKAEDALFAFRLPL